MTRLMAYDWPGNVRELENVVERALILDRTGPLDFKGFFAKQTEQEITAASAQQENSLVLDEIVSLHIRRALQKTGNRIHGQGGAAELPGINPSTLRSKMKKLGIR